MTQPEVDAALQTGLARAPLRLSAILPEQLGNPRFRQSHGLALNYVAGAMYKGIASVDLVVAMGRAGLLGFFGSGGLGLNEIEAAIRLIQKALGPGDAYGMNLLANAAEPVLESKTVELYLRCRVPRVEASGYVHVSLPVVHYRLAGLSRGDGGEVQQANHVIAKVSRVDVAERFMRPPAPAMVAELLRRGSITAEQAEIGRRLPVAQEICVEADSAGHTDRGNAYVLMPAIRALRDRVAREEGHAEAVRVGAAGGIGTPEAALAAFMLGADFIVTGSINQCTVEAGTSDAVKDILQELSVGDTDYAPAGDSFEIGGRIQVVKKGSLFPARAQKLYELYLRNGSLEEIDDKTRATIEDKYFRRSFAAVWEETRAFLERRVPERLPGIESSPKQRMAQVFRWYFVHSARLAMAGSGEQRVDYQIHCGPAMGALNAWLKGTRFESWRRRRVDAIGQHLMQETAALLTQRLRGYGAYQGGAAHAQPSIAGVVE